MIHNDDCERIRIDLMVSFDAESGTRRSELGAHATQHLAVCTACATWFHELESLDHRLQRVSYAPASVDLWPAVQRTLRPLKARQTNSRRLVVLTCVVLAWRALQLFVDLPLPFLHSVVPLVIGLAALWQLARDPLAVQTFAPELQKRGA